MSAPNEALLSLAARVEEATGPDRELNRAVAKLIGWHRVEPRFARNKHGAWIAPGDFLGIEADGSPRLDSLHGTEMHRDVPEFTASLDAAMTLLSEGSEFELTNLYGVGRAHVDMNSGCGGFHGEHLGGNIVLALLSAALKALSHGERG